MTDSFIVKTNLVVLLVCFFINSCAYKHSLTKFAYQSLSIPEQIHKKRFGQLKQEKWYKNKNYFCLYTYTIHHTYRIGSYILLVKGTDKIIIENNSDSAININTFNTFSKNVDMPDSTKNEFKKIILTIINFNPGSL